MPRKGENIFKRKDGRWEGRYIKGRRDGKAVYGYVFGKSYLEAKKKKSEAITGLSEKRSKNTLSSPAFQAFQFKKESQPLMKNIATQWLEELKATRKKSTIAKYEGQLRNYIIPTFGEKRIDEISSGHLIKFSQKLLTEGKKLSPRTVADILSRMKAIRKFAIIHGYEVNYIPDCVEISQKSEQIRVLTMEEERKLIDHLKENFNLTSLGILLSLFTGIRLGELCALKWDDFSLEEEEFHVKHTMLRLPNPDKTSNKKTVIEIGEPKSQTSKRTIPIPENLMSYLRSARSDECYCLSGQKYYFIEPRTMENRFKAILKKCGIRNINFHTLRHTFATRCVEVGFDIKTLSEILGHASVNITLNRYVHPTRKMKHENMNKLNNLF